MSLISRYILRHIWAPALLGALVVGFIMMAGAIREQLLALFEKLPIAQITMFDIGRLSFYSLPTLAGFIFPMTFLMGIMFAFGRMAQRSELIAMRAAGVSLKRIMLPVVAAGVVLSAVCFLAQDQGRPWAFHSMRHLLNSELPIRVTLDMLPKGVMHQYGGWRVYIGRKDEQGALRNIVVLEPREGGEATAFYADSAALIKEGETSKLELHKGMYIRPSKEGEKVTRVPFERMTITVPKLAGKGDDTSREGLTLAQLRTAEQDYAAQYAATAAIPTALELRKYRMEIADRFAFPLMCLAVSLAAAPIAARTKKTGRSFAFFAGIVILGAYFLLRRLATPEFIPTLPQAVLLSQLPNIVLAVAGAALIWRVDRV